jgi:hypothetical protein
MISDLVCFLNKKLKDRFNILFAFSFYLKSSVR